MRTPSQPQRGAPAPAAAEAAQRRSEEQREHGAPHHRSPVSCAQQVVEGRRQPREPPLDVQLLEQRLAHARDRAATAEATWSHSSPGDRHGVERLAHLGARAADAPRGSAGTAP